MKELAALLLAGAKSMIKVRFDLLLTCIHFKHVFVHFGTFFILFSPALDYEPVLRQVSLDVVSWQGCKHAIANSGIQSPYALSDDMMCAGGSRGHDGCQASKIYATVRC